MAVNNALLGYAIIILIGGGILLANSALGVKCGNECKTYKNNNEGAHTWLTINLLISVLMVIVSLIMLYYSLTGKEAISLTKPLPKPSFGEDDLPAAINTITANARTI